MMNNVMDKLRQFFSGYFHEDWPLEAASSDQVLAAYLRQRHSPDDLIRLAASIDSYTRATADDEELEQLLLADLGCYYVPAADGLSARAWLGRVATQLRDGATRVDTDAPEEEQPS